MYVCTYVHVYIYIYIYIYTYSYVYVHLTHAIQMCHVVERGITHAAWRREVFAHTCMMARVIERLMSGVATYMHL